MTRHELMCRMSGRELTAWHALFRIKAKEDEHRRHVAESGDGIVHISGRDDDEDEDDDVEDIEEVIDGGGDSEPN